jgi:hypothetical protein
MIVATLRRRPALKPVITVTIATKYTAASKLFMAAPRAVIGGKSLESRIPRVEISLTGAKASTFSGRMLSIS